MKPVQIPRSRRERIVACSDEFADPALIDAIVRVDQDSAVLRAAISNLSTAHSTLNWIYEWTQEGEAESRLLGEPLDETHLPGSSKHTEWYRRYLIKRNLSQRIDIDEFNEEFSSWENDDEADEDPNEDELLASFIDADMEWAPKDEVDLIYFSAKKRQYERICKEVAAVTELAGSWPESWLAVRALEFRAYGAFEHLSPVDLDAFSRDAEELKRVIAAIALWDEGEEILERLATDASVAVRLAICRRKSLSAKLGEVLSQDDSPLVRFLIAMHADLPLPQALRLAADNDERVAFIGLERGSLDMEVVLAILKRFPEHEKFCEDVNTRLMAADNSSSATQSQKLRGRPFKIEDGTEQDWDWLMAHHDWLECAAADASPATTKHVNEALLSADAARRGRVIKKGRIRGDFSPEAWLVWASYPDAAIRRSILKVVFGYDITMATLSARFRRGLLDSHQASLLSAATSNIEDWKLALRSDDDLVVAGAMMNWKFATNPVLAQEIKVDEYRHQRGRNLRAQLGMNS